MLTNTRVYNAKLEMISTFLIHNRVNTSSYSDCIMVMGTLFDNFLD